MNKANQIQTNIEPRQVLLYRNVFYSRVSTAVVFALVLSFLLQPIERIYAAEEAITEAQDSQIVNLAVDSGLGANDQDEVIEEVLSTEPEKVDEPDMSASTEAGISSVDVENNSTDLDITDSNETSTSTFFTDEEISDMITDGDALPDFEIAEESEITATTTENSIPVSTVFSDAVMQFNKNDCVTVEDGSFYCQNKKEETEQGSDGMYALQDKDGDLEIFVQKNGELVQLTFNTVDDAGPSFDVKSNSIVWHRLVNERYQIISYNLDSNTEVQLTADNVNNMEPSRSGDYTVWQRWNDTNWDIVLYNGTETKFITDSDLHDIAPSVKGDLVMWNRLAADTTQTIELYDIATNEYTSITDDEGGALSNPRMVLVYETEFANGDIVTKGYDVETGEITPLANTPGELPEELPEPDATGETGALLQPKNPVREDFETSDDVFPGIDGTGSDVPVATSTVALQTGDLVIASSSTFIAGSTLAATSSLTTTDMTLDLTPPVSLNPDIPSDLIIPPFDVSQIQPNLEMVP